MGYRYYLGKISKNKHNKIKKYTDSQLCKLIKHDCVRPYLVVKELCEIGEALDQSIINPYLIKFYYNPHTYKMNCEGEDFLHILTKEGLEKIINFFHEKIAKNARNDIKISDRLKNNTLSGSDREQLSYFIYSRAREWTNNQYSPYNLKDKKIVNSSSYEYFIFELAYIYKTFDFNKNLLVIYAY